MTTHFLKRKAKRFLQRSVRSRYAPIIVASMGRSGSTLVWDSVRRSMAAHRFGWLRETGLRLVTEPAWDLDAQSFVPGVVYKTHGLAHELPNNSGAKVIFLFGPATDAALSVLACRDRYGDRWTAEHFIHLRARGSFEELGMRDVLRFEEQLDGWIDKVGTQRLILHYDALWDHQETLSTFVGLEVALPRRQPRIGAARAEPGLRCRFSRAYASLDAKIVALPRCQVLE